MNEQAPHQADLQRLLDLNAAVADHDGAPPFNDQALIEARRGERTMLTTERGVALVAPAGEAELAVWPNARGAGGGHKLAKLVAQHFETLGVTAWSVWAHGDHPAARAIAERMSMTKTRELLQLRAPVPADAEVPEEVRPFTDGDAEAWVDANSRAFAGHPEQGRLTLGDLADRRRESWHSDDNLLLHTTGGEIDAFTWLKPQPDYVELYAVGVVPEAQGRGLGSLMMRATFGRMRELGAELAHLYVEGDNTPALELYRRGGFERWAIDVQYSV
ncbi:mycothiol synthase [Agrococcus casei]|uniref:Mycothiol synthase n=1 Tax=Agrococcus casei LMG 22410 TaxID=1255656 RepID=A0A1R4EUA8_9MICO|nr:mycothiol synthase [Agrococcus casei]SJM47274.1 Acetyl-CoA:Cys-GlcN-Ins acetyltransferase, mycothiol synthase MshD [Agrococcus casei LMG 22410]